MTGHYCYWHPNVYLMFNGKLSLDHISFDLVPLQPCQRGRQCDVQKIQGEQRQGQRIRKYHQVNKV